MRLKDPRRRGAMKGAVLETILTVAAMSDAHEEGTEHNLRAEQESPHGEAQGKELT
jgi:hypothetical protein